MGIPWLRLLVMGCLGKWGGMKEAKRGFVALVSFIWSLWESVLGSTIAYLKLTKLTKPTMSSSLGDQDMKNRL
jgi:hypothetical protein